MSFVEGTGLRRRLGVPSQIRPRYGDPLPKNMCPRLEVTHFWSSFGGEYRRGWVCKKCELYDHFTLQIVNICACGATHLQVCKIVSHLLGYCRYSQYSCPC